MDEISNTELAGRVEAVSWFVIRLAAELEIAGLIDGPSFCQQVRKPRWRSDQLERMQVAAWRLDQMADLLDQARASRAAMRDG